MFFSSRKTQKSRAQKVVSNYQWREGSVVPTLDSNYLITHKGHLINDASTLWMFIVLSYWHQAQFTVHSPRAVSDLLLLMPNEHFLLLLLPNNSIKTPGGFYCEAVAQNRTFVSEASSDRDCLSNMCPQKRDVSIFFSRCCCFIVAREWNKREQPQ